jgi:hypothetical protein
VAGYLFYVSNESGELVEQYNTSGTTLVFFGPDSVCCSVKAYDADGNIGPASEVVCVQAQLEQNPYDINGDGKVTGADVIELRLKVWFGGETEKHDINKDGKVTGADVIDLRLYIKENN